MEEWFFTDTPQGTHGIERQIAVLLGHAKHIAAVETNAATQGIAMEQRVGASGKPRHVGLFDVGLGMQGILLADTLRGEDDRLGGQRALIIAVGSRIERLGIIMAHLGTRHQFHVVNLVKAMTPFEHGLPRPLQRTALSLLRRAAIGEDGLLDAIDHIGGIGLLLTHGIAILSGIAFQVVGVVLHAKLRGELQVLAELQFGVDDGIQRTVCTGLRRVVPLFKDVEIGHSRLAALHILVVVIAAVGLIGFEIRIGHPRIVDGVGEAARIGQIALLTTLVGKNRGPHLQQFIQSEVGLQCQVITVILNALHRSLLIVIACRSIVQGSAATA